MLYMSELLSPFAHLEKELGSGPFGDSRLSKDAVQDGITRLLMDVEDSLSKHAVLDYALKMNLREIGVQTDNDPITDEAPEYAARPPPCKKQEMIPDMNVFEEIDKHATEVRSKQVVARTVECTFRFFSAPVTPCFIFI